MSTVASASCLSYPGNLLLTQQLIVLRRPRQLIGTTRRGFLDHVLFWNARDLERKLVDFQTYYNAARSHAARLRTSNLTTETLSSWPRHYFYDPNVFDDFPDVLGFYAQVDQQALAAFVNRTLVADRELGSVTYLQPVSQGVMLFALILLVTLTHRGVSGMLTRPIEMKTIRYIARFRTALLIAEISLRRFRDVWLSTDVVRCTALAFGLLGPGLYIRPKKGRALFFRTRDTMELAELLGEWRGAPVGVTANSGGPRRAPNIAVPPESG